MMKNNRKIAPSTYDWKLGSALVFFGVFIGWLLFSVEEKLVPIYINDRVIVVPKSCAISRLDVKTHDFANIICTLQNGESESLMFLNLFENKKKQDDIKVALVNKVTYGDYLCGNILLKIYSCYSDNLKIVVSSENRELVNRFINSQR